MPFVNERDACYRSTDVCCDMQDRAEWMNFRRRIIVGITFFSLVLILIIVDGLCGIQVPDEHVSGVICGCEMRSVPRYSQHHHTGPQSNHCIQIKCPGPYRHITLGSLELRRQDRSQIFPVIKDEHCALG